MGSMRFRRSKQIAPGLRVNVSKRGVGLSAGTKGARVSAHSTGSSTRSVGIPGTGIHYRDQKSGSTKSGKARQASSSSRATAQQSGPVAYPTVGQLLASLGHEARQPPARRALIRAAANGDLPALIGLAANSEVRLPASTAAVLLAAELNRPYEATGVAETFPIGEVANDGECRTLFAGLVPVPLVPSVHLQLPALAGAMVAVVHILNRTRHYQRVIDLAQGTDPTDDGMAAITVECGRAFNGLGRFESAKEELASVVRRSSLAKTVRSAALEQRVVLNLGLGKKAQARKDLTKLADLTPTFPSLPTLNALLEN